MFLSLAFSFSTPVHSNLVILMAPRNSTKRAQHKSLSSASTVRSRPSSYRSSVTSTPASRIIGAQRSLPPVSRVGPARQVGLQLPFPPSRSASTSSSHARLSNTGTTRIGSDAARPNDGDDTLNEIIMAVDLNGKGTVGCAYYVAADEKLYFMEDVELGGAEVVEACEYERRRGNSTQHC